MAKALGVHRPAVSEFEAGRRRISADELVRLAKLFDVSLDWLGGEGKLDPDHGDARLELAARELSKLDADDLDKVLRILAALRSEDVET